MGKIKAIFFDLDNTLIDFIQMKEESCQAAVKAMIKAGLEMNEKNAYEKLMATYFKVGLESDEAFTKFLEDENQFKHKILAAAINAYLKAKNNFLKPYQNVKSTLRKLREKGVLLAIVTDAPKTKAYQRLLAMGIESFFDFVVGFEDTGHMKENGLPLKLAMAKLRKSGSRVESGEVIMVGDSIRRDLLPAKKLDLRTALAKYGQKKEEDGDVDYELKDFSDILKIIPK